MLGLEKPFFPEKQKRAPSVRNERTGDKVRAWSRVKCIAEPDPAVAASPALILFALADTEDCSFQRLSLDCAQDHFITRRGLSSEKQSLIQHQALQHFSPLWDNSWKFKQLVGMSLTL